MPQEILAYADYRAMDTKAALAKYTALAADPEAPDALRARAKAMADFLKNGGAVDFGTVPPDAAPRRRCRRAAAAPRPSAAAAPAQ